MPRLLKGVVALLSGSAVKHEGAGAFDLSESNPLTHLTFTKGAALFAPSFYRNQVEELFSYSKALLAAERHERGFGWKFAAYMRDPKRGKGNRIQGTVASAILAAADPEGDYTEDYTYECLRHRADDVALFAAHFVNLGLGEIPAAARKGMARALADMDAYQILKYSSRQFPTLKRRKNGTRGSLRLVDAMGIAREHLADETRALYDYLRAPTSQKDERAEAVPLLAARRRVFGGSGSVEDFVSARVTIEQALSAWGSTERTWRRIMDVPGLLPDMAFKQYIRSMHEAGISVESLKAMAAKRKFAGLWPHQVFAGYQATHDGIVRFNRKLEKVFEKEPVAGLGPVFDVILQRVADDLLPPEGPALGVGDISSSMMCPIGGADSTATVMDAALTLCSLMSRDLGYAATFDHSGMYIDPRPDGASTLGFVHRLREGKGWGGTQVATAMISYIQQLLADEDMVRPRTIYFFSDMQFHPPEEHKAEAAGFPEAIAAHFAPNRPPLQAAIVAYRELIGPVDVVLWNLAAYDNAPLPSNMANVLMLAGFDANSFRHVTQWQAQGSPATEGSAKTGNDRRLETGGKDPSTELEVIRGF